MATPRAPHEHGRIRRPSPLSECGSAVTLTCYLMFPIGYRDLELIRQDGGLEVDHTTLFRWIQAYAPELEKRIRPHLHRSNGSWRVAEREFKGEGLWSLFVRAGRRRAQRIR